jgi:hypothetical protein
LLKTFREIIGLTNIEEFATKFNEFYIELREKSENLKTRMVEIYKLRDHFVRAQIKDKYNCEKLFTSIKDSELVKILKRTPMRNESFLDLFLFIKCHMEKCKRHSIMEIFRAAPFNQEI